jgi:hypothetical protein
LDDFDVNGTPPPGHVFTAPRPPHRRRAKQLYLPVLSEDLARRLAPLPGQAWPVYSILLLRCKLDRAKTVTLTTHFTERFGIGRHDKCRALATLEAAGLVRVRRRPGHSPVVTVLATPPSPEEIGTPE